MPEWLWWVLGGLGIVAGLYMLVNLIILAVVGTVFTKVWDRFWDVFDDDQ